jgi:hypothetical protein
VGGICCGLFQGIFTAHEAGETLKAKLEYPASHQKWEAKNRNQECGIQFGTEDKLIV